MLLPHGKIALGKLAQARMYGAEIIALRGNFDDALRLVRELGAQPGVEVVNSINPVRIEGQKTAAFEICDVLGRAPDFHFLPVGNAGNITAYWKRLQANITSRASSRRCRACAASRRRARRRSSQGKPVTDPQTIATAIRIGNPASWAGRDDGAGGIQRRDRKRDRRGNPRRLRHGRAAGGPLRRARQHRAGGRACCAWDAQG